MGGHGIESDLERMEGKDDNENEKMKIFFLIEWKKGGEGREVE